MLSNVPKGALGLAAGISGLLFLGYCIYFDSRRRSDPDFRKRLREKRRQKRLAQSAGVKLPDLRDSEAVQKFFLSEVQTGEELLSQGHVDEAVEHLGRAIAVCGHPQQLLQLLQQTLPPTVFHILLQRLPMIGQQVQARQIATYGMGGLGGEAMINHSGGDVTASSANLTISEKPAITEDDELE